jgi:hypothetical protein
MTALPTAGDDTKQAGCLKPAADAGPAWISHPAFLAHMNMLQAVIARLAGNSASCKTWCSGLVTALLGVAASTRTPQLLYLALAPVLMMAFLDASYLRQEQRVRAQFEALAAKARAGAYGCADLFEFHLDESTSRLTSRWRALLSWSIWPYYGGLVVAYLVARSAGWLDLLARPVGG